MSIFDLQDAYLVIAIAGVHMKFLIFEWQGRIYMYIVMPFGLAEAPRKLTKLLKPILAKLRRAGIILAIYIDDRWVKGRNYSRCLHNILVTMKLFAKLGFLIHKEKLVPIPSQQVNILSFDVDSVTMLVTLGDDKTNKAITLCKDALCGWPLTIWFLAKVIGTLISVFLACPWGRAHYQSLENIKLKALILHKWDLDAPCMLYGQAIKDLQWWIGALPHTAGPIQQNKHTNTVFFRMLRMISGEYTSEAW